MNEEYLNGLQDASIDVLEHGCVFAEKVVKELNESSYSDGYLKGYNLMLERGKLIKQPTDESLKIKTKHPFGCLGMKNLKKLNRFVNVMIKGYYIPVTVKTCLKHLQKKGSVIIT